MTYRVRLVESATSIPRAELELWVWQIGMGQELRVLQPNGEWRPIADPAVVDPGPPTARIPIDLLTELREEIDRVTLGRLPGSADAMSARAMALQEALEVERSRVDRVLAHTLREEQ